MLKTLKPDHYYIIVNLDEPYAQDIYEVLRYGQKQKERLGEDAWPEGDVDYMEWVKQTWANACPRDRLAAIQAARIGQAANLHDSSWPEREYYSLLASIRAERDALAAEVERLRRVEKAAKGLTTQLHAVHRDHRYYAVWQLAQQHMGQYQGPQYGREQDALDAALAAREALLTGEGE